MTGFFLTFRFQEDSTKREPALFRPAWEVRSRPAKVFYRVFVSRCTASIFSSSFPKCIIIMTPALSPGAGIRPFTTTDNSFHFFFPPTRNQRNYKKKKIRIPNSFCVFFFFYIQKTRNSRMSFFYCSITYFIIEIMTSMWITRSQNKNLVELKSLYTSAITCTPFQINFFLVSHDIPHKS